MDEPKEPEEELAASDWAAVLLRPFGRMDGIPLDSEGRVPGELKIAIGPAGIVGRPTVHFIPLALNPSEHVAYYVDMAAFQPMQPIQKSQILAPSGVAPLPSNVRRFPGGN